MPLSSSASAPSKREKERFTRLCHTHGTTLEQSRILLCQNRKVGFILDYGEITDAQCLLHETPTSSFKEPTPLSKITMIPNRWKIALDVKGHVYVGETVYDDTVVINQPLYKFSRLNEQDVPEDTSNLFDSPSKAFIQVWQRNPHRTPADEKERPNGKLYMGVAYSEPQSALRKHFSKPDVEIPQAVRNSLEFQIWMSLAGSKTITKRTDVVSMTDYPQQFLLRSVFESAPASPPAVVTAPSTLAPKMTRSKLLTTTSKRANDMAGKGGQQQRDEDFSTLQTKKKMQLINDVVVEAHKKLDNPEVLSMYSGPMFVPPAPPLKHVLASIPDPNDLFFSFGGCMNGFSFSSQEHPKAPLPVGRAQCNSSAAVRLLAAPPSSSNHSDVLMAMQQLMRSNSMEFFDEEDFNLDAVAAAAAAPEKLNSEINLNMSPIALFHALKHPDSGTLSRHALEAAVGTLLRIKVPPALLRRTFDACDLHKTGKVTLDHFVHALEERERELRAQFDLIDLNRTGEIALGELQRAKVFGLFKAQEHELNNVLFAMDRVRGANREGGKIRWAEFRSMMILLPPATTIQTIIDIVSSNLASDDDLFLDDDFNEQLWNWSKEAEGASAAGASAALASAAGASAALALAAGALAAGALAAGASAAGTAAATLSSAWSPCHENFLAAYPLPQQSYHSLKHLLSPSGEIELNDLLLQELDM